MIPRDIQVTEVGNWVATDPFLNGIARNLAADYEPREAAERMLVIIHGEGLTVTPYAGALELAIEDL